MPSMKTRTIAVNGNSLALSSIVASLEGRPGLRIVPVQQLGTSQPDVILFDLAAPRSEFDIAWWKAQPNVLLIGVDLGTNELFVLSGHHPRMLTFENLYTAIQDLPQEENKGGHVTNKQKKYVWFTLAGAALASLAVFITLSWPPVPRNKVQGAIGERQVYRQEQLTDKDVGVAGQVKITMDDIRILLQSPDFKTLVKDPQIQKMLAEGKAGALNNLVTYVQNASAQVNQLVNYAQTNQAQANQLLTLIQTNQAAAIANHTIVAHVDELLSLAQTNLSQANQLFSLAQANQSQLIQNHSIFAQTNQSQVNQLVNLVQSNQALVNKIAAVALTNQAEAISNHTVIAVANQVLNQAQVNQAQVNQLVNLAQVNQAQTNQIMSFSQMNQLFSLAHDTQGVIFAISNNLTFATAFSMVSGSQVLQSLAQSGALSQAITQGAIQNSIIQSVHY